jgi:glycosyltransferase involved in cell wall biosynthesis
VADYRDGWYFNHIRTLQKDIFNKIIKNWELRIEKKITQHADLITTVDPEMAERLCKLLAKKVEVVYNGFWDFHKLEQSKKNENELIINHTGTLTPGQQLELFLDVIRELYQNKKIEEGKFLFNLVGLEYFPEQMKRLIPYNNLLGKIVFTTPRLPKEEAIKLNAQADYLLNFTDPNLSAIYAKTYDYIASKKPILVVPGDKKLLENLVVENKLGFVFNSKEEIKTFITNPIKWNPSGANVSFFTRKSQTEALVLKIRQILCN